MTAQKVIHLLADILGADEEDISEQTALTKEYGVEPIDTAKLVIEVENSFHIKIYDDEAAGFRTVGDIVRHIDQVLGSY